MIAKSNNHSGNLVSGNAARRAEQIREGAQQLNLTINSRQEHLLLHYLSLLLQWNKAYNLSAVCDPHEAISRHLLDSLSVAPHLYGERLIDVGTGAGLPGIPLAIMFPEKQFTLLDSNGKKTRFLFQVKTSLQLNNVIVENQRVENYYPKEKNDGVLSRAFTQLDKMVNLCGHLLKPTGLFWAMKGTFPQDEINALSGNYKVVNSLILKVPACQAQRHLLILSFVDNES